MSFCFFVNAILFTSFKINLVYKTGGFCYNDNVNQIQRRKQMSKMTIDTLIAYLEDFKRNLVPGKQLYVQVNGELLVCSDKECNKVEASI